ncbi:carbohydrate ABC transporter permease [Saccharopolyspora sp. 5N708]|uniref:carbohydrate ABC transporter permease n=1 Tax=Saccharopolyspora sp. 5N708 TaxID=3457424 RepID=UPI003FD4C282
MTPSRGAWAYLTPLVLVLAVTMYGPLVFTVLLSVVDWDFTSAPEFAALQHYLDLFTQPEFPAALARTVLLVVCLLPFATALPMALAILLWKRPGRASTIYRTLLFTPVVLAPVANALSWQFLLNPLQGMANQALGLLGFGPVNWLGNPHTALPAIALITAGKIVALNVVLYGAALSGLDPQCVEAARADGATEGQVTRHVLIPQLVRTTGLLVGVTVVLAGQWAFTNVAVLTQGGPDGVTDNVYYRIYTYGFTFFEPGTASAAAVVLMAVLGAPLVIRGLLRHRRSAVAK